MSEQAIGDRAKSSLIAVGMDPDEHVDQMNQLVLKDPLQALKSTLARKPDNHRLASLIE